MKTHELREKKAAKVAEMRSLTDKPQGSGGDLSETQARRFDELRAEVKGLEKAIERAEYIDDLDRRAEGRTVGGGDQRLDQELRKFSLVKALAGAAGLAVDDGREREMQAELAQRNGRPAQGVLIPMEALEKRVVTTTAPAAGPGSNLIATDHLGGQYIDMLRAKMICQRLGARVLSGLHGNVEIPKLKASSTGYWVAENAALTAADAQFTEVTMSPKHAGALMELSRNMLQQSSPDVEQLVRSDMAQVLARAVDSVAIQGGGSNEPDGILETSGIGSVAIDTNGGPITWAKVIDLIAELEVDNAEGTAFASNAKVVKSARQTLKVSGDAGAGFIVSDPGSLAGYPLASTNLVPSDLDKGTSIGVCSALIFGNWSDLLIGYWSTLDVLVNPYESTAYSKGNVQIRAMLTCDVAVRHPESFAAIQDLTTA